MAIVNNGVKKTTGKALTAKKVWYLSNQFPQQLAHLRYYLLFKQKAA